MKTNVASPVRKRLLQTTIAGLLTFSFALSGLAGPREVAPRTKQSRKAYYVFTTGSKIAVPADRITPQVATTSSPEQVIRITERNRLGGAAFINRGGVFGH